MSALSPPVLPQLAKAAQALPEGAGWAYEPKWDGYRVIAFVTGGEAYLQSRNKKPLNRYFPELVLPAGDYVLDGEIVVLGEDGQPDFNALGNRIHPAASRVERLAVEMPARIQAFDLLARGDDLLLELPFSERRAALEELVASLGEGILDLTPQVDSTEDAAIWLREAEGVIAKQLAEPYRPGERLGMVKVRRQRTVDCVVIGYRAGEREASAVSLLLAMVDADGKMRPVGHSSGFSRAEQLEVGARVEPRATGETWDGEPTRWRSGTPAPWIIVEPELVVEVNYEHASNGRIRHGARLLRWRSDKAPGECSLDQLV